MMLRPLALALALLATSPALACTPGDMVTLTREEDGALFNPDAMAQGPEGSVYRGLFDGHTVYLNAASGTSGFRPPRRGLSWDSDLGEPEDGQVIAEVMEGPLQGRWRATCQATN
jgi:hypothetical protein